MGVWILWGGGNGTRKVRGKGFPQRGGDEEGEEGGIFYERRKGWLVREICRGGEGSYSTDGAGDFGGGGGKGFPQRGRDAEAEEGEFFTSGGRGGRFGRFVGVATLGGLFDGRRGAPSLPGVFRGVCGGVGLVWEGGEGAAFLFVEAFVAGGEHDREGLLLDVCEQGGFQQPGYSLPVGRR